MRVAHGPDTRGDRSRVRLTQETSTRQLTTSPPRMDSLWRAKELTDLGSERLAARE